jgi:hypothetical protein
MAHKGDQAGPASALAQSMPRSVPRRSDERLFATHREMIGNELFAAEAD